MILNLVDRIVRTMNKSFPWKAAAEAFDLMMGGKARFRAVLTTVH